MNGIEEFFKNNNNDNNTLNFTSSAFSFGLITEIGTNENAGKVKVKFFNRSKNDYQMDFIRIMTPFAGNNYGLFFPFEVGMEVVVGFLDGCNDVPFVLGCLWNDKNKKTEEISKENEELVILKTKKKTTITLSEKQNDEKIKVETPKGLYLELGDKESEIKVSDKSGNNCLMIKSKSGEIILKADRQISLESKGNKISIDSSGKINLDSKSNISVTSLQTKIEGKSKASISSSGNVEVKAIGEANIKATGLLNLKGSITKIN